MGGAEREHRLDAIRGWAALAVAVGHCATATAPRHLYNKTYWQVDWSNFQEAFFRLAHLIFHADAAVLVFFVLSGHVLFESLVRSDARIIDFPSYTVRRIYRLWPALIVSLTPLAFLTKHPADVLVGNMLLLNSKANGITWSLQTEVFGSLLIFAVAAIRPRLLVFLAAGALLFIAIRVLPPWHKTMFLPLFLFGCAVGTWRGFVAPRVGLFWLGVVGVLLPDLVIGKGYHSIFATGLGGMLMIANAPAVSGWFLDGRIAQLMGALSYPFFLLHLVGAILARKLLIQVGTPLESIPHIPGFLLFVLISVPIAYLLAAFVHVFVEMPCIDAGRILAKRIGLFIQSRISTVNP